MVTYAEGHVGKMFELPNLNQIMPRISNKEHHHCLDSLEMCKNYTFYVSTVSPDGKPGGTEMVEDGTMETG